MLVEKQLFGWNSHYSNQKALASEEMLQVRKKSIFTHTHKTIFRCRWNPRQ